MLIVAYSMRDPRSPQTLKLVDHWLACETVEEAEKEYAVLVALDACYCASICRVIKSTDYSPTPSAS